ncbi:hypothetical protein BDZ91DRAFT_803712 [Kalaharituber pfeilii]|nr:hypothetical protein BDZ91DRAFT_803712 [Kalaharituber pfeilii]
MSAPAARFPEQIISQAEDVAWALDTIRFKQGTDTAEAYVNQPLQNATAAMIDIIPAHFGVDIDEGMACDRGVQIVETVVDGEAIEALIAALTTDEKAELMRIRRKGGAG